MPRRNDQNPTGGMFGIRPPVQIRQDAPAGWRNDVLVPILLAGGTAIAAMLLWLALLFAIREMEGDVFWVVACVVTFIASVWIGWAGTQYDEWQPTTIAVNGLATAILLSFFSLALYKVTYEKMHAALALTPLWGAATFFVILLLSNFQEALFRSPFIEQAAGSLLTQQERPHWRGKPGARPLPAPRDMPIMGPYVAPSPEESIIEEYRTPPAQILLEKFLVAAQRIGSIKRAALDGALLGDGTTLSQGQWSESIDYLVERGFVVMTGNGYDWKQGASPGLALASIRKPVHPASHPTPSTAQPPVQGIPPQPSHNKPTQPDPPAGATPVS